MFRLTQNEEVKMDINWEIFCEVLAVGWFVIALQGIVAYFDGFLSHAQMLRVYGSDSISWYSFMDHGGMWSDFLLVSPLLAYLVSKYQFSYTTGAGIAVLVLVVVLWILTTQFVYVPMGKDTPEAHAHSGYVTTAGWIHVGYASVATWIIVMAYLSMSTPAVDVRTTTE